MKMGNRGRHYLPHTGSATYKRREDHVQLLQNTDFHSCTINQGEEDEVVCHGFILSRSRQMLYYILCLSSGFILAILGLFYPCQYIYLTCKPCFLEIADFVVVKSKQGEDTVCRVNKVPIFEKDEDKIRSLQRQGVLNGKGPQHYKIFVYRNMRYIWEIEKKSFVELRGLDGSLTLAKLRQKTKGISVDERRIRLRLFGENNIDYPTKSLLKAAISFLMNPLHMLAIVSCGLWWKEGHYVLTGLVSLSGFFLVVRTIYIYAGIYQPKARTCKMTTGKILQRKPEKTAMVTIPTEQLVPGDLVFLNGGEHVDADIALLGGDCLVDESMLTGKHSLAKKSSLDSLLHKSEVSEQIYLTTTFRDQTLYSGSYIVSATTAMDSALPRACGVVVSTGFATMRGRMIRHALGNQSISLTVYRDTLRLSTTVFALAFIVFSISVFMGVFAGSTQLEVLSQAFAIISYAFPPVLPIALMLLFSSLMHQFRKRKISCFDLTKIEKCGEAVIVCLDKTGSITSTDLTFVRTMPLINNQFIDASHGGKDGESSQLMAACGCCHSLQLVQEKVTGDPMEVQIVENSGWTLCPLDNQIDTADIKPVAKVTREMIDPGTRDRQLIIWKRFPFDPELRAMSVVVTDTVGHNIYVYTKGAPEVIYKMSTSRSLPKDYHARLESLLRLGYRVLAYGMKVEEKPRNSFAERIKAIKRDEVDTKLEFLGFVILENRLKDEVEATIKLFQEASLRPVMVTGDSLRAAVGIGGQCGLIQRDEPVYEVRATDQRGLTFHKFASFAIERKGSGTSNASTSTAVGSVSEVEAARSSVSDGVTAVSESISHSTVVEVERTDHNHSDITVGNSPFYRIVVTGTELMRTREQHSRCYHKILLSSFIFAEMSPRQKSVLIGDFRKLGLGVCMCGDGENDTLALSAADVGIRMSSASRLVSEPFRIGENGFQSIATILLGCKTAAVKAANIIRYLLICSLVVYTSSLYLQYRGIKIKWTQSILLTTVPWLFTVVIALKSSLNVDKIIDVSPRSQFYINALVSIFLHTTVHCGYLYGILYYIRMYPWYGESALRTSGRKTGEHASLEGSLVFLLSSFHFTLLAAIFLIRSHAVTNALKNIQFYMIWLSVWCFHSFLLVHPGHRLQEILYLHEIPDYAFSITLFIFIHGHAFLSYVVEEHLISNALTSRLMSHLLSGRGVYSPLYRHVIDDLRRVPLFVPEEQAV